MRTWWVTLFAALFLLLGGCSSSDNGDEDGSVNEDANDGGNGDTTGDPGPGDDDPGDPGPGDTDPGDDDPGDPGPGDDDPGDPGPGDTVDPYTFEFEIGHSDGVPALKLLASPDWTSQYRFTVPANRLPVRVVELKFRAAGEWSGTLRVLADNGGTPGATLGQAPIAVAASDVDDWVSIDVEDQDIVVDGDFWMVIDYPGSITPFSENIYGSTSCTGRGILLAPGFPPYTINFDPLQTAIVASANDAALPAKLVDGDPCTEGMACESGFCSGGRCSKTCVGGDCGTGRRCELWPGGGVCVTDCTTAAECPIEAFCLTDTTLVNPAGLCVADGPRAQGQNCQYNYHSVCETGNCTACVNDPTACPDPGTCEP